MDSLIQRYPAVFWKVFWAYVGGAPSQFHISNFKEYLIHTIAPKMLNGIDGGRRADYRDRALRDELKGPKRNREEDSDDEIMIRGVRDRFAELMRSLAMNEALTATGAVIYPHPDALSVGTLMGMDMRPSGCSAWGRSSCPRLPPP